MSLHHHLVIVVGRWKLENWHLYRWTEHRAVKKPEIRWHMWDRVL